jgi:hypothetical protein
MSIWKLSTGEIVKNASGKVVSCADCPCGSEPECACCDSAATSWTVDFGAATLVDDDCDYCDQIAGEFVLDDDSNMFNGCRGSYYDAVVCTVDANDCNDGDVSFYIGFNISGTPCKLSVDVRMTFTSSTTCSGWVYEARYELTLAADEIADCNGTEHTLTKVSETMDEYDAGKQYCTGNFPDAITLRGNA